MFYLSKIFGNKIKDIEKAYPLGFSLDYVEGTPVKTVGGLVPKALVRQKDLCTYAIGYGFKPISPAELRQAEIAKATIIDELAAGSDPISTQLFEKAQKIAMTALSQMDPHRAQLIAYLLAHDTVGYGPISILLEDRTNLEEIEINAPTNPIAVHTVEYGMCQTNLRFTSAEWFRHFINKIANEAEKELSEDSPIVDAEVENVRLHAQTRPYAQSGGMASIRISGGKAASISFLLNSNTASEEVLAYVWLAIDSGVNLVVAGAPASGKTTLLGALIGFIPRFKRLVTIEEDIKEILFENNFNNTVALYGSKYGGGSVKEQVINSLRMRPDRLIVGEIRGEETREMFAGANLGIPFMTTMHSNQGAPEIIKRLLAKPMDVDPRTISMLDLALYMKQVDIAHRQLESAYEYRWLSRAETLEGIDINAENSVRIEELIKGGLLNKEALPHSKVVEAYAIKKGISKKQAVRELEKRAKLLKELSAKSASEALEEIQEYEEAL